MTSLYGRRCSSNHVGMLMSGMLALAVLSLLDMSRVCSVPCHDTNLTWMEEVRIWICGEVIIIFVIEDRSEGGGWWGREQKVWSSSSRNIMMQQMHQLITNGRSRLYFHHRLALCITGFLVRVHGKNGWRGEQAVSRSRAKPDPLRDIVSNKQRGRSYL